MPHKLTINKVLDRFKERHGETYDYSLVEYTGTNKNVDIICKEHGIFKQEVSSHFKGYGCSNCAGNKKYTTTSFIEKAKEVHNNKYQYNRVDYKGSNSKITITCPEHGDFQQVAGQHIFGAGCTECLRENPTGWSKSNWFGSAIKSKSFDSYKVYLLKLKEGKNIFYKIGRTYNTINERFRNLPKEIKIIEYKVVEECRQITNYKESCRIYDLENSLKKKNIKYKYTPNIKFKGMYECFSKIIL